jgi:hypothetical protein
MRKAVIRAANTWHFMYLIAGTFLFLAVGPALAMFINEPIFIFAVSVMGISITFVVWWTTGSLLTTQCIVSESGIESSCWFGLHREVYYWQDCIGFGLLRTPDLLFGIKWLYFSDRWRVDGYSADGFIEWEDTLGQNKRPKVGQHFLQIQCTPKSIAVLKEYMPSEMFEKIEL